MTSSRQIFSREVLRYALASPDIYVVTADLGYGVWDIFRQYVPDQYINVGAAEQAMLDVSCGLALAGKTAIAYTITPFFLRGFETLRTYVAHEQLPIILAGSGRNKDYEVDGFSHDASDMQYILGTLKIQQYYPSEPEDIPRILKQILEERKPAFLSLQR